MNWIKYGSRNWIKYGSGALLAALALAAVLFWRFGGGIKPLTPGSVAPAAVLALLDGRNVELTDHQGQGQIITFMSSWCPCSNESIPMMKKAYQLHGENGHIAFLMIGIQDAREKFAAVNKKWDVPFPVGFDQGDRIARAYGVKQPPTTVFIGKDGLVKRFFYGNIKDVGEQFYRWVEELL